MPAKSKAQQRLIAMALREPEAISDENKSVLSMDKSDMEDFASTPTKGLPNHAVPLGDLLTVRKNKKKRGRKK